MINSKVYGIIMSLNWILKTDSFFEKFNSPNIIFSRLHLQGESLYFILYDPKITEALERGWVSKLSLVYN